MTPLSILVVDDDETSLAIIAALLESHGHNVTTQDTGFGTSRRILRDKPDVVVLDIEMPGLNGDDIIKLLREAATRRHEHLGAQRPGRPADPTLVQEMETGQRR